MKSSLFVLLSILACAIAANVTAQPWTTKLDGSAFLTNVSVTGPKKSPHETFSTNWLAASAEHSLGGRGRIVLRVRGSAEGATIKEQGYPQLFQVLSRESGGPSVDRMRAQPYVSEASMRLAWSGLHLDLAPVGVPPLGAEPFVLRESSRDFAEAPFAYDVQESFHDATRLVGGGITTGVFGVEGGVFHQSINSGRRGSIDDGTIDSWAARVTVTPVERLALQVSRGSLGNAKRKVSSASVTYGGALAASAIWTRRDMLEGETLSSLAAELAYRGSRLTLMARGELTDRPPFAFGQRRTDVTFGAIVDILRTAAFRTGAGVNVDYHTNTKALSATYGHKPQSLYLFVRIRGTS